MEILIIVISAVFVNNILLSQFLGICPFLGVSNKVSTALGMSAAVMFVMALSTMVTYLLQHYVLVPLGIEYMQTISFILVIAALVQMVEIVLKKISPALYQALGIFLPLITTNCAVLGVAIMVVTKEFTFGSEAHILNMGESVVYALASDTSRARPPGAIVASRHHAAVSSFRLPCWLKTICPRPTAPVCSWRTTRRTAA